jgi:hypothetical protein
VLLKPERLFREIDVVPLSVWTMLPAVEESLSEKSGAGTTSVTWTVRTSIPLVALTVSG